MRNRAAAFISIVFATLCCLADSPHLALGAPTGGSYVEQKVREGMAMFLNAARNGQMLAMVQLMLGDCYATGDGIAKDATEAVKWYRKAAEQGHKKAAEMLKEMNSEK